VVDYVDVFAACLHTVGVVSDVNCLLLDVIATSLTQTAGKWHMLLATKMMMTPMILQ